MYEPDFCLVAIPQWYWTIRLVPRPRRHRRFPLASFLALCAGMQPL